MEARNDDAVSGDGLWADESPAIVVGAPNGWIAAVNQAFCAYAGYGEVELVGQPVRCLQPATVAGSLVAALQAQQAGSGFSVHEVPLRKSSGIEERATIRASPLYCIETGALQGFSLLLLASTPFPGGRATNEDGQLYTSPTMPAASVEGLRNVAPSVLRLLQICDDTQASGAWPGAAAAGAGGATTSVGKGGAGGGGGGCACGSDAAPFSAPFSSHSGGSRTGASDEHMRGHHPSDERGSNGVLYEEEEDEDCEGGRCVYVGRPPPLPINESTARSAWSVLCASVMQKSMFSNVLLTQQRGPDEGGAAAASAAPSWAAQRPPPKDPSHHIWHVSAGLEALLGHSAQSLIGREVDALFTSDAPADAAPTDGACDGGSSSSHVGAAADAQGAAPAAAPLGSVPVAGVPTSAASYSRLKELHEAVSAQRNCLIEVVLPTADGGVPRFCLAYVLPLHCNGPRASSVAVAFLDVHASLPYMQRHMEARGFGDCDLYTFVKFSLLNCLVTDPSVRTAEPAQRNPIVFASAGFGVMCGCAPHEVMHRNCRFLQSPSFVASVARGTTDDATFPQHQAVTHMSAALDARHESLTYLHNFRKDGTPFANLLFMTPILDRSHGGVLFWIGVQHPLGETPAVGANSRVAVAGDTEADLNAQLRSCQQALHSVQLQELYGSYTAMAQRTALLIQSADVALTSICRLCEHHVLADAMPSHTQYCKVVTQCKTIASCSDAVLARQLVKLNAASSTASIFGAASTPAAVVVDLVRNYDSVLLNITASTTQLPILESMPAELDRLVAAAVQPSTASVWADIRSAGQRKLAALQHACSWAAELQHTIVHMPTSDPLAQGQPPCLQDFEMVREIQRGSHATVWLARKRQTRDIFAMKVIDKRTGRLNRLQTERKVLFLCASPFVVKTFYAFEDADSLYLVMERLHQDCKHVLQQHGAMSEAFACPVLADMVLALEHLHSVGICHRDLKPENMLLTPSGRLKLADFGLSHITARVPARPDEVAKDPSIVGTPFYMAPETIRGKARGHENAADWWSFGVIMYEFLLGFPPFQGAKVGEIYRSILSLAFTAPIANCAVSPESMDLIARLIVPDPRRRLTGASAVMSHPWFGRIDWRVHAHSAGQNPPHRATQSLGSLESLAATGGSLAAHHAKPTPVAVAPSMARPLPGAAFGAPPHLNGSSPLAEQQHVGSGSAHSGSAHSAHRQHAGGDADVARSVHSVGMDSERSMASTNLADLASDGAETNSHLDNLMGLNERRVGVDGSDLQQDSLMHDCGV